MSEITVITAAETAATTALRRRRNGTRAARPRALGQADAEYFESVRRQLLRHPRYAGSYVAVHDGRIVGTGRNELALFKDVTRKYGDVPLFIGRIERHTRVIRVPSPRAPHRSS